MCVSGRRVLALLWGAAIVGSWWVTGCAREGSGDPKPAPPPAPTAQLTSMSVAAPVTSAATRPSAAVEPGPVAPEPKPELGADHLSVAPCQSDADCGWDDPCVPERCMAAVVSDIKCSESRPAPGACLCVSGGCTLKPKQTPKATGPCEVRGVRPGSSWRKVHRRYPGREREFPHEF